MKKLAFFFLFISSLLYAPTQYLVIHGTWAKPFSWHMPGGNFYDALAQAVGQEYLSFFLWSGKNSHIARKEAAEKLVNFIDDFTFATDDLVIISHSHGGNVVTLASQIMAKDPRMHGRITRFFALATPVCSQNYAPDMHVIGHMYNLFSFNDLIQPVFGIFKREYPSHERIANIAITINGKEPLHTEVHHPAIARWLPLMHTFPIDFTKAGFLEFFTDKAPRYKVDEYRKEKIDQDLLIQQRITNLLRTEKLD